MEPRSAALLRWEAIVSDPVGALFAVLVFKVFVQLQAGHSTVQTALALTLNVVLVADIGYSVARAISYPR